jgi:hypothetical protein
MSLKGDAERIRGVFDRDLTFSPSRRRVAGEEVHLRRADEAGHEFVLRIVIKILRGADLLDGRAS